MISRVSSSPWVSSFFTSVVRHATLREVLEAPLGHARRLEQVLARAREEVVELGRSRNSAPVAFALLRVAGRTRRGFLLAGRALGVRRVGELTELAGDEVRGLLADVDRVVADPLEAPRR